MKIGTLKTVRWSLMGLIAVGVASMVGFSFMTGYYVGNVAVRLEAIDANAGYWAIFGDGKWHWAPWHK